MKAYRILILLLILVSISVSAFAQGKTKFIDGGSGEYAKKFIDFHSENYNSLSKKIRLRLSPSVFLAGKH